MQETNSYGITWKPNIPTVFIWNQELQYVFTVDNYAERAAVILENVKENILQKYDILMQRESSPWEIH